jgi:hypothetical protein
VTVNLSTILPSLHLSGASPHVALIRRKQHMNRRRQQVQRREAKGRLRLLRGVVCGYVVH